MATQIVSATTITKINDHFYQVRSASGHRDYTVNPIARVCSCPDALYRGNTNCKHLRAVDEQIAAEPQPTALAAAAPKAARLSDEELRKFAAEKNGTAAGCACLLELAARQIAWQNAAALKAHSSAEDAPRPAVGTSVKLWGPGADAEALWS